MVFERFEDNGMLFGIFVNLEELTLYFRKNLEP